MRFVQNPFREPGPFPPPSTAAREFHRTLPGYAPTPLVDCQLIADSLGLRSLHVKDESHRFGLNSFKALGASYAMHSAMHHSAHPGTIFSAATAGNHGRAVAWSARRLQCLAKIFVPYITTPARIANIRNEGADVTIVDGSYEEAVRQCDAASRANGWQVISDTGYTGYMEIPKRVAEGYQTLFLELEGQYDVVLIQAGVGGLLSAAVDHFRSLTTSPMIISVEPDSADCLLESISSPNGDPTVSKGAQNSIMAGLNCSEVSLTAWPTIRRGVDRFLSIEDRLTLEAMEMLRARAISAGESGAAGLAGVLAIHDQLKDTRVLIINTEGQST